MTKLARDHGVSPVSAALHVEYYALKEWVAALRESSSTSWSSPPAFIELKALPPSQPRAGVVELEDPSGAKMTLRLEATGGLDALALVQAFWRRAT